MTGCRLFNGFTLTPDQDVSAIALTPSNPSTFSSILLWNSSGSTLMPKGIQFHFILPRRVLNVFNRELSLSYGICQRADLISAKENTLALLISVSRWSTVEIGYSERLSVVFSGLLSMHSLIPFLADGLFTIAGVLTHSVGSVTFSSIPFCWRPYTSAIRLLLTDWGTALGAVSCE